ncbi:glycosyltransferase family 4 protein [Chryseobacterium arthrosphaerae]|uniref:glycosyltransferase family 4 protein n=1 Tax=Chryseobacterium arthrosphaerae TaxID=651561 RepID=UPI0023E16C43|nr:glycosyltransferase family 4 protein [Chryseobacterium arthrosphaerae]WET00134.1 glycosyltransferase family 4 protein [Chryseobacterium arthrosphaerae]
MAKINTLEERGIYHDLMREFSNHNHNVYIVSPIERRENQKTIVKKEKNVTFLNVKTLNIQKTNFIEKGISTLTIEKLFLRAIKKFFSKIKFDLVVYSTPPITFTGVIKYIKRRDNAKTYLLLKDIFPQNAVDMKMLSEKSILYRYFRSKEKDLYNISDKIGCMSEANVNFILNHNKYLSKEKIEINPNSIELKKNSDVSDEDKMKIRKKYQIPYNRKIFIYGGNLGKPQGIDFLIETLQAKSDDQNVFFVIAGSGTEYNKLESWFDNFKPQNALLLSAIPKVDYDLLVQSCDVGLIFLHKDFTIPNYPSRLLSYLEFKMPVLAATDSNTDIGTDIVKNNCGIAVSSDDLQAMIKAIDVFKDMDGAKFELLRQNSLNFLKNEFQVNKSYVKIIEV